MKNLEIIKDAIIEALKDSSINITFAEMTDNEIIFITDERAIFSATFLRLKKIIRKYKLIWHCKLYRDNINLSISFYKQLY